MDRLICDKNGIVSRIPQGMMSPVRCRRCGQVYDLCAVEEIVARYADCTVYKSPCCNRTVDDRTWSGSPDIEHLRAHR